MVVPASPPLFFLLPLLGLAVVGQEEVELLFNVHQPASVAVSVDEERLAAVASSVLQAESWLRGNVLSRYPSANVTSIVVGKDVLCSSRRQHRWPLVLPSVKNLHYSLVRWGLVREIKVSVVFSNGCLDNHHSSPPTTFRDDLAQVHLKSLLQFLQSSNAAYTIRRRPHAAMQSHHHQTALSNHGFSHLHIAFLKERESPTRESRKLITSVISSPYPVPPKPSNHHLHTSTPTPSFSEFAPSPATTTGPFSFVPSASPIVAPGNPPDNFVYTPASPPDDAFTYNTPPPCPALSTPSPLASGGGMAEGLWCVAKPAVPAETLQEAIDYACGHGGADCAQIAPHGDCYYPDNVVAHASFAFNSYWQKTKRSGGSCGFGGTAILIDSDPSFQRCQFELS